MSEGYISVRNWRKFQHYDPTIRVPPWIKNNTELMADDDYLRLSEHRALMLHRLWLEYATSRCRLSDDTARLSRRLSMKVTRRDIEALSDAGFINIVASASLADGYQDASASRARANALARSREEEDTPPTPPRKREGGNSENGRRRGPKRTGYKMVRGSHAVSYVRDPEGTDPLPPGWQG